MADRLISADDLIERAYRLRLDDRERVAQMIESAPTVDAEPVVRCKDCKNLRLVEGARGRWFGCSAIDGVDGNEFEVEGDFFCAWGERREDGKAD